MRLLFIILLATLHPTDYTHADHNPDHNPDHYPPPTVDRLTKIPIWSGSRQNAQQLVGAGSTGGATLLQFETSHDSAPIDLFDLDPEFSESSWIHSSDSILAEDPQAAPDPFPREFNLESLPIYNEFIVPRLLSWRKKSKSWRTLVDRIMATASVVSWRHTDQPLQVLSRSYSTPSALAHRDFKVIAAAEYNPVYGVILSSLSWNQLGDYGKMAVIVHETLRVIQDATFRSVGTRPTPSHFELQRITAALTLGHPDQSLPYEVFLNPWVQEWVGRSVLRTKRLHFAYGRLIENIWDFQQQFEDVISAREIDPDASPFLEIFDVVDNLNPLQIDDQRPVPHFATLDYMRLNSLQGRCISLAFELSLASGGPVANIPLWVKSSQLDSDRMEKLVLQLNKIQQSIDRIQYDHPVRLAYRRLR